MRTNNTIPDAFIRESYGIRCDLKSQSLPTAPRKRLDGKWLLAWVFLPLSLQCFFNFVIQQLKDEIIIIGSAP